MGEKQSKGYWQDDDEVAECNGCGRAFTTTMRRHHCRNCGYVFCGDCSRHRAAIPMRGITSPERVCDACYLALRNSNVAGSTLSRGGPGMLPNPSETPNRDRSLANGGIAGNNGSAANNGGSSNGNATGNAASAEAAVAAKMNAAAEAASAALTEEQRKAEEYYQNLYGGGDGPGDNDDAAAANAALTTTAAQETMSPEAMERERLIQRWNTVRQATVYVDILVQQSERVEADTQVGFSRETELLMLDPAVAENVVGVKMLPMPRPCTDSPHYLLEPVKVLGLPATVLDKAISGLAQRLAVRVAARSVHTAAPTEFTGY